MLFFTLPLPCYFFFSCASAWMISTDLSLSSLILSSALHDLLRSHPISSLTHKFCFSVWIFFGFYLSMEIVHIFIQFVGYSTGLFTMCIIVILKIFSAYSNISVICGFVCVGCFFS